MTKIVVSQFWSLAPCWTKYEMPCDIYVSWTTCKRKVWSEDSPHKVKRFQNRSVSSTKAHSGSTHPLHCDNNNEKLPIQVNVSCGNQLTFCFNSQNLSEFPSEKIPSNATTVQLSHNTISTLQNNSLTGLSNLVTLILSKNCIENIVPGVFLDQGKLKRLDLGDNNLTSLRGEIWVGLSSLEILRITGNKLQNLSPHAFNNLPKLKLLAVGFTLLVEQKQKLFDPSTFSNPTTQPQIALQQDEKTLVCNSSNCWLKEKEDQGLLVHYEKNGWPFRPKCSDQSGLYWDQADLKCSGTTSESYLRVKDH